MVRHRAGAGEAEAGAAREPRELRRTRAARRSPRRRCSCPPRATGAASGCGSTRPAGTPSTRRSGAEPKFASTSTPTVAPSSGTTPARRADAALPVEAHHPGAGADGALGHRRRPRAAASARPASAASTCTIGAVGEPAVVALGDERDHDVGRADGRVGGDGGGDRAVEDPPDRHRRREVDRRLDQPPLRHRDEAGHLPRAVEHRGAGRHRLRRTGPPAGPGRIAVTPVRARPRPPGSSRHTVTCPTAHAVDVGDRVRRPGLAAADPQPSAREAGTAGLGRSGTRRETLTRRLAARWPPCPSCGATTTACTSRAPRSGSASARRRSSCPRAPTRSARRSRRAGHPVVAARPQPDAALEAVHDRALLDFLAGAYADWTAAGLHDDPGQPEVDPVLLRPPRPARPARAGAPGRDLGAHGRVRVRHDDADRPRHLGGRARAAPTPRSPPPSWCSPARPPPTRAPARRATTSRAPRTAAAATSTTPRSPPSGCARRSAGRSRCSTSTRTTATARRRSSTSAATCAPARSTSTPPPAGSRTSSASPARTAPAPGDGANRNLAARARAPATTAGSRRCGSWRPGPATPARSSSRSASTRRPATPRAPLAVTADGFRAAGRALGALGLPTVVVQEGGYDVDAIGGLVLAALEGIAAGSTQREVERWLSRWSTGSARTRRQGIPVPPRKDVDAAAALAARGDRARRAPALARARRRPPPRRLHPGPRHLRRVAARPRGPRGAAGAAHHRTASRCRSGRTPSRASPPPARRSPTPTTATSTSSPAAGGPPRRLLEAGSPVWVDDRTLVVSSSGTACERARRVAARRGRRRRPVAAPARDRPRRPRGSTATSGAPPSRRTAPRSRTSSPRAPTSTARRSASPTSPPAPCARSPARRACRTARPRGRPTARRWPTCPSARAGGRCTSSAATAPASGS